MQGILGHVVLTVDHVLNTIVVLVTRVDGKKDIVVGFRVLAEGGHQGGLVGVADVVFAAVGHVAVPAQGGEHHFGGIEIGAVGFFRKPEGKDAALLQAAGRSFVLTASLSLIQMGPKPKDGHLPGVPVGQPVETEDLVEIAVALGVPAHIWIPAAIGGRCQQGGKDLVFINEFKKISIPHALVVVLLELGLPLFSKKAMVFSMISRERASRWENVFFLGSAA